MGLTPNISIANMPQTRANQIPIHSSLFRMGIRLTTISEAAPGMLEVGPYRGRS